MESLASSPALNPLCKIAFESANSVMIQHAQYNVSLLLSEPLDVQDKAKIKAMEDASPESYLNAIEVLTGVDQEASMDITDSLVRAGVVVDTAASSREVLNAEYIAYRLVDHFRTNFPKMINSNPLWETLNAPGARNIAVGFLLESYCIVRSANRTALPVLSRRLSRTQRNLLEDFFIVERTHGDSLAEAISELELDTNAIDCWEPIPETELYERFLFSCGHSSPLEFASALIVPEVEELPPAAKDGLELSIVDLLENVQGIPKKVCDVFRSHEHTNDVANHGLLPVQLIKEAVFLTREEASILFRTVDNAMHGYDLVLRGILRWYSDWDGKRPIRRILY